MYKMGDIITFMGLDTLSKDILIIIVEELQATTLFG